MGAIAIVDYGMGNIHSVKKALESCGAKALVANNSSDIKGCSKIVLPGVGAFDEAMVELRKLGLAEFLKDEALSGKPFIGICLGMQLLFEASNEAQKEQGLGMIKGRVVKIEGRGLKVPHMGWNQLIQLSAGCPLLNGVADGAYVYFCHSYYARCRDMANVSAVTEYGEKLAAVVNSGNVYGVQFHPEKSQSTGLKIIDNFVNLC